LNVRQAMFALRVVRRRTGDAAIVYRRTLDARRNERLTKIAAISPLAFTSGAALLRAAVRATSGPNTKLATGPFHPLDADWGARVCCYGLVTSHLRNSERMHKAAANLQDADGSEAAWWLGLMQSRGGRRAIRALRILIGAVR
jgi:hypothetical protein